MKRFVKWVLSKLFPYNGCYHVLRVALIPTDKDDCFAALKLREPRR